MKFVSILFLGIITSFASTLHSQEITSANPFYLGHSLVNFNMPAMVHGLANDAGKNAAYDLQIINGAPLIFNFNNADDCQGTPYTDAFPNGEHDVFILTEAVPLQNHLTWNATHQYADSFLIYALANNNGNPLRYAIYETWHCTNTGLTGCDWDDGDSLLWHPRLLSDWPLWTGITDHVRSRHPLEEVCMVPAGQAFYNLTTQINAGNLPGINHFTDLFSDDIHLTNAGNYFVACVMYGYIYKESPLGLTTTLFNEWGIPFADMPSPEQAAVMQEVAWQTLIELNQYSCVEEAPSSNSGPELTQANFKIYPNPAPDWITLQYTGDPQAVFIFNSLGQQVLQSTEREINLAHLEAGIYFIQSGTGVQRFVKL
jgi:hypothetical protein